MSDSEYRRFMGCSNPECCSTTERRRPCGYLQKYSNEGLCNACEYERFFGRFSSCPFCRTASIARDDVILCGAFCIRCDTAFEKWLEGHCTFDSSPEANILQRNAKNWGVYKRLGLYGGDGVRFTPLRFADSFEQEWRGFYRGDGAWRIPDIKIHIQIPKDVQIEKLRFQDQHEVLLASVREALHTAGIDLWGRERQIAPQSELPEQK